MKYIDNLIQDCVEAKLAEPIQEFKIEHVEELPLLPKIKQAIYVIKEIDGDPISTFEQFRDFKLQKSRKCAKLNKPNSVLYVGSSTTSLVSRLKQHFGYGNKATYSLHLSHWFKGKVKVSIYQYDLPARVLQIVEDNLSDELKPAFGKLGGNNK